ncbi:MAG: PAS domain-containing sensor histidine kinase [Gemmatimonadaceae bacterium]
MSSSTGDRTIARGEAATFASEGLAELLAAIAEAGDFASAGLFFLEQMAIGAGASRGCLLGLNPAGSALEIVACMGVDRVGLEVPVDDLSHPLVLSLLALVPVSCPDAAATPAGFPFERWTAVPFPKPRESRTGPLLDEGRARSLAGAAGIRVLNASGRARRLGHAGSGVLLLDSVPSDPVIASLADTAMLAGPVLSRMASLDDLRRAGQRLDQQRALLTSIVNALPDPIIITDNSNDIVVQNARAEHLLSFSDAHSEGRRRAVEINNLLFTSFLSKAVMAGGVTSGSRELNLVDPDEGTDLLFEVLAHPLPVGGGHTASYVSVLRDVTDLKRASNELERELLRGRLAQMDATRERDRLNLILENVADPILVTDDRSNIILMNRHAEALLQAGEDSGDRRRAAAVRGNDTRVTTFISEFALASDLARREQMGLIHPASGRALPIEIVSGKIMNERGEPLAIVSVLHDLTKQAENDRLYAELKKFSSELEQRVQDATSDLAEQNARLQWQSRELEKANRLKSEFLASMSHELRTPINALIGYTALMLDRIYGDLTPKQEDGLKRIQASAQHLLALINDILDLARIEAGKMPLHLDEVALPLLVSEINQQIEPMVRKKALDYRVVIASDAPVMITDRIKVKQILLNLLSNAAKFTPKGHVALEITPVGDVVQFDVTDTGIGIDSKDLDAIWEDFRQLDQSRTREYGGTGLGLSITRKLVARLGGTISARSRFGSGTTFSVTLPAVTPASDGVLPVAVDALPVVNPR